MGLFTSERARAAILGYLEGRCDVSSQHKLPSREELYGSVTASLFEPAVFADALSALIREGKVREYGYNGVYLSDREIDVL